MDGYNRQMTALETRMGYTFKDQSILVRALTHSSYGDGRRKVLDYEQLEFLGDRVLGLLTADMLYRKEAEDEGGMARKLNALVRKETCAKVSKALKLGDALLMSPSEAKQGGREKISILGDACEALIAAIYIDGGIEAVSKFYYENWKEDIEHVLKASMKDPKTMLQEKSASIGAGSPEYSVLDRSGPDHKPIFVVNVNVEKIGKATGTGTSKKDAERVAASQLLENWPL